MKVFYITPNSTDPLAFYRGTGPLRRMRQDIPDFHYTDGKEINWAAIAANDLVFIQRPYKQEHLNILKMCQTWNVPTVIDFDDWLFDLPESNFAVDAFNALKPTIMEICKLANHIMVASEKLKELHERIDVTNITVVPNAYDSRLFPYRHKHQMDRSKIFLWRGGNSHLEDIISVKDALNELIAKHKDWQFAFIAQHPWMLKQAPNLHFIGGMGIPEYFRFIHDKAPALMSHPLKQCEFNEAKSMCSWIEATHARACFVGPNFKEFQRPGCVTYEADNQKDYFKKVDNLITNPMQLVENMQLSNACIMSELEIRNVNKVRYQVFENVLNSRK